MNDIQELLDKARDIIIAKGWSKGTYESSTGEVCLAQAIGRAAKADKLTGNFAASAVIWARLLDLGYPSDIIAFNDRPEITEADVLALLSEKWETYEYSRGTRPGP